MKTLLLGLGNPILADDNIGLQLAASFKAALGNLPDLDIVQECSLDGISLVELFHGYDRVILLDSLQTTASKPGTWHRFSAAELRETIHLTNIHDTNIATALAMGRRLGLALPEDDEIHIFAIEIEDNQTFSERMTPTLERLFPSLQAAIFRELRDLVPEGVADRNVRVTRKGHSCPPAPENFLNVSSRVNPVPLDLYALRPDFLPELRS